MPFRDAYKKVGLDIEAGNFTHDKQVHHSHEGSIGNLCNDRILDLMEQVVEGFNFVRMEEAERALLDRWKENGCKIWLVNENCLSLHPSKRNAEIAQLVEHNLAKVGVASSSLVFRSSVKAARMVEW